MEQCFFLFIFKFYIKIDSCVIRNFAELLWNYRASERSIADRAFSVFILKKIDFAISISVPVLNLSHQHN